jgi:N-acyl-D-amino-acid deacylase
MFDVLIRDGWVLDGTGSPAFRGAVAAEGDRIRVLRGSTDGLESVETVDACGKVVAPGFIDVHTHSGLVMLAEPREEPKTRQGVTTEVIGVDGLGYAPLSRANLVGMLVRNSGLDGYPDLEYNWTTIPEYLGRFNRTVSANVAYLIPNSCLRVETVGWENRPASAGELKRMQAMIREGMAQGAIGMSTGLAYPPGSYADTTELVALCETVAECGGVYVTHVRYDLGDGVFDGFREAVTIGKRSGCPIHLSHFFAGYALRGQTARMLAFVDEARAMGVDVTFDSYPWEAGSTMLDIACPQESYSGGPRKLLERLADLSWRDATRGKSTAVLGRVDQMVVSAVSTEANRWCEGLTIGAIAARRRADPWDTICDLLVEEQLAIAFYNFGGDMGDVKVIITHPAHMFCSDALRIGGMPNPRTYGTYPKVLGQLVRDEKVMTLEQAVRKMTSFPAQRFGLLDRGVLRDGMKADIVIFDPQTVSCVATFNDPKRFPLGIEHVLVNGVFVVRDGAHTGALPGEPLAMMTGPGRTTGA